MQIIIYRKRTNRLYTEGELVINDDRKTFTVEATGVMLPAGTYTLRIVKKSQRKQSLVIFRQDGKSTLWRISIGHSYISSLKDRIIAIGKPLMPGAVFKASKDYERLMDRFSKCTERGESMTLIISEEYCHPNQPIQHWLRHSLCSLFAVCTLFGCSSLRQVPVEVVREISRDTLVHNRIQYDSIYIDNWQFTDRTKDTIYLEKSHIEYRYKLLHDTVRVVQIDSIPVVKEVEVVKVEKYTPWIYRASFVFVFVFVFVQIIRLIRKIRVL